MSISSVLYTPDESRGPGTPPLTAFRPGRPIDVDPDLIGPTKFNVEVGLAPSLLPTCPVRLWEGG